jgi:predicted phosphoribosyltransferase
MARFTDRAHAGRELAVLIAERGVDDAVILALPRGGVPVAAEIARALRAELDVLVVRKLRMPGQPELAFGAVASGDVRWLNDEVAAELSAEVIEARTAEELREVHEREHRYRGGRAPVRVAGRTAVLVDDGIATGATVHAAVEAARLLGAQQVIVAAPIAPPRAVETLERVADRVDVVEVRRGFGAVSVVYDDFTQVADEEVARLIV